MVIENEFSDFHKKGLTMIKVFNDKSKTNAVYFRNTNNVLNEAYMIEL